MEGGSKNSAAAQQEVVDLSKFLYLADATTCDVEHVTTMSHVVTYLNRLRESGVGPSGQITKLTTLMDAMKMLIARVPDDGGDEKTKDMIVRSRVVETKLKGVCKSLRKENTMIRVQKRELFDTDSDDRDRVLALLDDDRLFQLVSGYLAQSEMAEPESLMARRYLMCHIMYKHAQRQGAVVNLRLSELSRAVSHPTKSGDRVHVYKVNHFTEPSPSPPQQ